jgi:hypothetical protein
VPPYAGSVAAFQEAIDDLIGAVQEVDAAGTNRALLDRADVLLDRADVLLNLLPSSSSPWSGPSQSPWPLPPSSFLLPPPHGRAAEQ